MKYLAVLLITVLNCVVLFFMSLLAAGGDGSATGVYMVWMTGYPWIALCSIGSLYLCIRGKGAAGMKAAAMTLPAGYIFAILCILASVFIGRLMPNLPEFDLACKNAGVHYISSPKTAVQSIGYDWKPGTYQPYLNYFEIDKRGNIRSAAYYGQGLSASIKFIEKRCNTYRCENEPMPYFRRSDGKQEKIPELTADVLLKYDTVTIKENPDGTDRMEKVNIVVSDRRDGETLATLRYVHDGKRKRVCGTTSKGVMSENDFISRAINMGTSQPPASSLTE